jgi:hypothetical protein
MITDTCVRSTHAARSSAHSSCVVVRRRTFGGYIHTHTVVEIVEARVKCVCAVVEYVHLCGIGTLFAHKTHTNLYEVERTWLHVVVHTERMPHAHHARLVLVHCQIVDAVVHDTVVIIWYGITEQVVRIGVNLCVSTVSTRGRARALTPNVYLYFGTMFGQLTSMCLLRSARVCS